MSRPVVHPGRTRPHHRPAVPAATIPASRAADGPALPPEARTQRPESDFRPDIEGLRAVAVLLVVVSHAGVSRFAGGYVGVDVFFVISGFLITSLLVREVTTAGRLSIARFYARRAVRLLPASSLVLVATLVGSWLWLSPIRIGEYAKDALASAFYLSNVRFAAVGTEYLNADSAPSPFQHFWSLAVEEQFYLVWPLLIIGAAWVARRSGRQTATPALAAVLGLLVVGSFALSLTETQRSAPWSYFGAHTRAWELGVGAMLALAAVRLRRLPGWAAAVLAWLGLAAVLTAAVTFDEGTAFPGAAAAVPVLGTAAIIAAGCTRRRRGVGFLLSRRPMQTIGRLSYGWYLWHWPVLLIGPAALGITAGVGVNLVLCAVAFGLAAATYRLVENPLRHRRALRARPVRGIGLGLALSSAVAAAAVVAVAVPPSIPVGQRDADLPSALRTARDPAAVLRAQIARGGRTDQLPANLTPPLETAGDAKPRVWRDGCHVEAPVLRTEAACVYGDPRSATTVVLFGDSHAAQWFPAVDRIARDNGWRLVSLSKAACPAADLLVTNTVLKRPYTECQTWRAHALQRIAALQPSLVIVGSSFNYEPAALSSTHDVSAQWRASWDRTYTTLLSSGARVTTIVDTPYMGQRVPHCLAENPQRIRRCAKSRASALRNPVQRVIIADLASRNGTTVIDPVPWLCSDICPPVLGNVLVYRDSNHLTTVFAASLARLVASHLPALHAAGR